MITLSEQQRQQYLAEGYTEVRQLIPLETVAAVRSRLMELLEDVPAWGKRQFQVLDPTKFRNAKGQVVPVGVQLPAQQEEVFRAMADHPNLQAVMAQLLGGPVKRFTDQALIKNKAVDGQSFYHQDSYYWHLKPELGCNCWIALDEVGKDAIALAILPGTHLSWTLTPHEEYFDDPKPCAASTGQPYRRFRIPEAQVDISKEVLLPMRAGDGAFFTNFTWHRAEPNRSGMHKCAYAIAYQLQ